MVYDMERNQFVVDLDNVHSFLEVGQVGWTDLTKMMNQLNLFSVKETFIFAKLVITCYVKRKNGME